MVYEIVEIEIQSKTINNADPTNITRMVGKEVICECETLEKATAIIEKIEEAEQMSYSMSMAMCGGDSELMGPQNSIERFVVEKETGDVFTLQMYNTNEFEEIKGYGKVPVCEIKMVKENSTLDEMFSTEWVM